MSKLGFSIEELASTELDVNLDDPSHSIIPCYGCDGTPFINICYAASRYSLNWCLECLKDSLSEDDFKTVCRLVERNKKKKDEKQDTTESSNFTCLTEKKDNTIKKP